jgi:hypothetical protein
MLPRFTTSLVRKMSVRWQKRMMIVFDLTRGRTWNLLIAERIVVKRLAIGPLGQIV